MKIRHTKKMFFVILLIAMSAPAVCGADFVPIREYKNLDDSPFPDFGIDGALIVETFEDPSQPVRGLSISSENRTYVREGFSVADDIAAGFIGNALEATPAACATTFPQQCPAIVTLDFDERAFSQLPTYVGYVWTDAVRALDTDVHPWMRAEITNAAGESVAHLINELPLASNLDSAADDDTLISFVDQAGIRRVEITVMTNGVPGGGHFAIDHIQFGVTTLPGDTNLDGVVDFRDFLVFSREFGNEKAGWGEGDFTFDGKTDFVDLLKLTDNFGKKLGQINTDARTVQGVPEPNAVHLTVLWMGVCLLYVRRPRR